MKKLKLNKNSSDLIGGKVCMSQLILGIEEGNNQEILSTISGSPLDKAEE